MEFNKIKTILQTNVESMMAANVNLYTTSVDKDTLWNLYLSSFPAGTNELVNTRTEHDCNHCKQFIRAVGNVVSITADNELVSIWDVAQDDDIYGPVFKALSKYVRSCAVNNTFIALEPKAGIDYNIVEIPDTGRTQKWQHFFANIPKIHQNKSSVSTDTLLAAVRDNATMLEKSLNGISKDALASVIELIKQDSIYRGAEWLKTLEQFYAIHIKYHKVTNKCKLNFCWRVAGEVGPVISKIKNHSMGTLLTDVTEGVPLDEAIRKYEAIVAPTTYKRPKPVFTKKMLADAKALVEQLGLTNSLRRRFATLDDITVNNVLFADRSVIKRMTGEDAFADLAGIVSTNSKTFNHAAEISIDSFIKDVLPTATKIEMLVEPRHRSNVVSLIAPAHSDSKTMFKWGNNFSWAYVGNIADSMKEQVKASGGKVDGVLRFSIQWNENGDNHNDFDAHCIEPRGKIYYGWKHSSLTDGRLDVDIIQPETRVAIENITYPSLAKLDSGSYRFYVNVFSYRGGDSGVRAQIEFDDTIFDFDLNPKCHGGMNIEVATVKYSIANGFELIASADNSTTSANIADVNANSMQPLTMCMLSPNYWDGNAVGNKHYLFMVKGAHNDECPNGFFNEYLTPELLEHKRVFAALGDKMAVEPCDNQLTGFGFSSTKRDHIFVKVYGHTTRMLKVLV